MWGLILHPEYRQTILSTMTSHWNNYRAPLEFSLRLVLCTPEEPPLKVFLRMLTQGTPGMRKLWEGYWKPCKNIRGPRKESGLPLNYDVAQHLLFRCHLPWCSSGALVKPFMKHVWGWDCDHPRHSWYGKAMRKLWEGHKPHLRERSCLYGGAIGMEKVWESSGNSRNMILLHKVFHSSMKKSYEKPEQNFFLLWETAAGIIPAMVPWARQYLLGRTV